MCCSACLSQGSSDPTPPPDPDVVSSGQCHPKRFMMGGGAQGPQLSRLVSAVGAEEEGGEVTTCVAVISKDTSAVPSVSVCNN